ncbi:MAG: GIY-YIG nuclease family protein [SAR324 cluster bacterium]|nr:GIY-YIG nuclease family protein [SAR324 cluster bacterium]
MKTQRINSDSIPPSKGTYLLFLSNTKSQKINIGKQGGFLFPSGLLVYVGSALGAGGLRGRISHHLRVNRKCHWHIDYLLQKMPVYQVLYIENPSRLEHKWAMLLERIPKLNIPMKRFGASDCQCASHLFNIPSKYGGIQIEQKLKEDVLKEDVMKISIL